MHRRTAFKVLVSAAASAALGACSARGATTATATPASRTKPTSRPPTAPPSRKAPDGDLALATRQLALSRGSDRPLPTTVWYPRAAGSFPLILFSHGLGGAPRNYSDLLTSWARAGFVVAAPAYPHTAAGVREFNVLDLLNQPADASEVITRTLAAFKSRVDPQRIAAAGHSGGGITTLGMFTGNRDERLRSGVVLSGRQIVASPFTGAAAPLLFIHGKRDTTVSYADGRAAYDAVSWPKAFLTITDGGHLPVGEELDVVAATSTDFWRWSLYGDRAAKSRLGRDATRGGLATLADKL